MTPAQAAALGLVQGVTEWLPVSSSAHLRLAREALGVGDDQAVDVALHLGTAVAAGWALRADLARLVPAGARVLRRRAVSGPQERLAVQVGLSVLPAAALGAVGGPWLERRYGAPRPSALLLGGFGLLLAAADRLGPQRVGLEDLGPGRATGVSLAQALALAPGVSRSGVTLTAARALGVRREDAVRLSALLALPVVAGAAVRTAPRLRGADRRAVGVGVASATLSGAATLHLVMGRSWERSAALAGGYRVVVAAVLLARGRPGAHRRRVRPAPGVPA